MQMLEYGVQPCWHDVHCGNSRPDLFSNLLQSEFTQNPLIKLKLL